MLSLKLVGLSTLFILKLTHIFKLTHIVKLTHTAGTTKKQENKHH